ncbi:hypothetical protein DP43_3499 [Burkholderia pseudomallei]|nr:hypothetical protein DP43_3499 [Burkholderia pseudomallei]
MGVYLPRIHSNSLNQMPRKVFLKQELRLLSFLALPPISCLNSGPINFPKARKVRPVLEVICPSVRQRKRPTSRLGLSPSNSREKIGFQMNYWPLTALVREFGVLPINQE